MVYGWAKFSFLLENPMQNRRTTCFEATMTDRDIWKIPKATNTKSRVAHRMVTWPMILGGHVTYYVLKVESRINWHILKGKCKGFNMSKNDTKLHQYVNTYPVALCKVRYDGQKVTKMLILSTIKTAVCSMKFVSCFGLLIDNMTSSVAAFKCKPMQTCSARRVQMASRLLWRHLHMA